MTKKLVFDKVSKSFGDFVALKNVSFDVNSGEIIALLGPNGAGKTTLINCLSGITNRTSGQIWVDGIDPQVQPLVTKSKLGIVEQELTFDPFFTPMEILRFRRGLFGLPADDAFLEKILKQVGLLEKANNEILSLSGGMKRRLMIAKALAHDPEILILDEPTAGVDIELRQKIYGFLRHLKAEGKTIILTTHYLEEAEELADRIVMQKSGETVLVQETKALLATMKRVCEIFTPDGETHTFTVDETNTIPQIVKKFPDLIDIKIREPKLEDIFSDQMGTE